MNITTRTLHFILKKETHKNSIFGGNETRISNNSRHQQTKSGIKKGTVETKRGDVKDKIKEDVYFLIFSLPAKFFLYLLLHTAAANALTSLCLAFICVIYHCKVDSTEINLGPLNKVLYLKKFLGHEPLSI